MIEKGSNQAGRRGPASPLLRRALRAPLFGAFWFAGSIYMDMHGKQQHSHSFYKSANSANILCSKFEMMPQKTYYSRSQSRPIASGDSAHRSAQICFFLIGCLRSWLRPAAIWIGSRGFSRAREEWTIGFGGRFEESYFGFIG